MDIRYIADSEGLETVRSALDSANRIALDCEAAGYHRYSDRLCLLQLTVGDTTFVLDPFGVDPEPVLRPALEDPGVEVLMHGADFDVRLLDRDLGIGLAGLFDTQIAASLLGVSALGLSSLLESRLGVELSKKYQKADWAQRPLPQPMLQYAALDTAHLHELAAQLRDQLERLDRLEWAKEEFRELQKVRFDPSPEDDPVLRVKKTRDLSPREIDRLREALFWRDRIGREQDRALFRVVGDDTLVAAARLNPTRVAELEDLQGMNTALAREWGADLIDRFRRVDQLPDSEVEGYPAGTSEENGSRGRSPPEVEERFRSLKKVRNERATEMGIDRGTLLPNAILQKIAEVPPKSPGEFDSIDGMRRWQAGLLAEDLLGAL